MREQIARLMELQVADRQLQDLEQSLASIAGRVDQLRAENQANQAELQRLTEEDQQAAAARKKLEKELAEGEARIRNKRMRLNMARTDRELQALTHEVDALKEANQEIETKLLAMIESVDSRGGRIKELGESIVKGRAELVVAEKEIAAEVEELKGSIAKNRRDRERLAREIDSSLLRRYETLFSRRGGMAVAIAKGGTCMGCRRLLPPQLYNEVLKHLRVHYCPNCQRILYYEG
ncbi:MAG TPA: C4-type zinc ribbon domain-containing protein [Candidatus Binataceae bacterium]|nr:C4-type zinc ribbon domain-containing protein [Candidatus Binataceae bacterium]